MITDLESPLKGRRVLVGATGSIAAVKTPLLVSALAKAGANIKSVLTPSAQKLVSPVALATLGRSKCYLDADQWDPAFGRPLHIELAEWAELFLVAPLSSTSLSRWSQGSAEGLLASLLLACECPILVAASMNTAMWAHPGVEANWQKVKKFPGVVAIPPVSGRLSCDRVGQGLMADPVLIELAAASLFRGPDAIADARQDWRGLNLLVTAGATNEPLDVARFISNRSSGRMGVYLAQAARFRGASVQLVHGQLHLPNQWLEGLNCHPIQTSVEMERLLIDLQPVADVVAMVAAVSDLRRKDWKNTEKFSKSSLSKVIASGWEEVPDLLKGLADRRPFGQRLIGFSALTGSDEELIALGERKRSAKGCDLLVVNPIDRPGQGFASDLNAGWLLGEGWYREIPLMHKLMLANKLLDSLLPSLGG